MNINLKIIGTLIFLFCFTFINAQNLVPIAANIEREEPTIKPQVLPILFGKIICIDPGHAITSSKNNEKLSPLSEIIKPAYVKGTKGKNLTEETLNLAISLKLSKLLENNGAKVIMTREVSEITISNIERAEMANNGNADVCIHIHADYSSNPSMHGISVLIPSGKLLVEPLIIEPSALLGKSILDSVISYTGAVNLGTSTRNDLTGFNWSKVPTIMIEVGFMSNPQEDELLETDTYQDKIAEGIYNGLVHYFYPDLDKSNSSQ